MLSAMSSILEYTDYHLKKVKRKHMNKSQNIFFYIILSRDVNCVKSSVYLKLLLYGLRGLKIKDICFFVNNFHNI